MPKNLSKQIEQAERERQQARTYWELVKATRRINRLTRKQKGLR